jgi:hypothetical protein
MGTIFNKEFPESLIKKSPIALFNLSIKLDGWQGPFKHFNYFLDIARIAEEYSHLKGDHYVTSNGEIKCGKMENLHTFEAEIDLTQKDHIHYGKRFHILPLYSPSMISFEGLYSPVYTLKGLYETIPRIMRNINSKIERLSQEFDPKDKIFNSIAKKSKTKLKLLENKYRREISDQ